MSYFVEANKRIEDSSFKQSVNEELNIRSLRLRPNQIWKIQTKF
jgi:hypothetical protein